MFDRPHHRRIAAVLEALNADLLAANECLFGGGTAMALRYGEYRESVDMDFLVSHTPGYRDLRQSLGGPAGLGPIVRSGLTLLEALNTASQQSQRAKMGRIWADVAQRLAKARAAVVL